jgi:hypothetical protein
MFPFIMETQCAIHGPRSGETLMGESVQPTAGREFSPLEQRKLRRSFGLQQRCELPDIGYTLRGHPSEPLNKPVQSYRFSVSFA